LGSAFNRSGNALLLALLVIRLGALNDDPASGDLPFAPLHAPRMQPGAEELLRNLVTYEKTADGLGSVLERGLAHHDNTRRIIARAFSEHPRFLFDGVLGEAHLSPLVTIEFIQVAFDQWCHYRKLSPAEAKALAELLRPSLIARLRRALGWK
jgi:hypothetical protein